MKKVGSFALIVIMVLSLTACGDKEFDKSKAAYEYGKEAYENVNAAYEITEKYGADIYTAWSRGIYNSEEVMSGGCAYLADELSLSEDEIAAGAAYILARASNENWDELTEEERNDLMLVADTTFSEAEDDLFSWCVNVVSAAYIASGKAGKVQGYLTEAKTQMKDISENYSEYEHYPALKGYYTTTYSFFDFCQNPTGTFEQLGNTIEDYTKTARDYNAELSYIFEE